MGVEKNKKHERESRKKAPGEKKIDWRDMRFVGLELTKDLGDVFDVWVGEGDSLEVLASWIGMVEFGAKLSVSYSEKTESFVASASYPVEGHVNSGLTLTAHAESAAMAVALLVFKDQELCESGSWLEGEHTHGKGDRKRL